jgi:hypothetical protein
MSAELGRKVGLPRSPPPGGGSAPVTPHFQSYVPSDRLGDESAKVDCNSFGNPAEPGLTPRQ